MGSGALRERAVGSGSCADEPRVFREGAQPLPCGVQLARPWFSPNHLPDSNESIKLRPVSPWPPQGPAGRGGGQGEGGSPLRNKHHQSHHLFTNCQEYGSYFCATGLAGLGLCLHSTVETRHPGLEVSLTSGHTYPSCIPKQAQDTAPPPPTGGPADGPRERGTAHSGSDAATQARHSC